MGGRDQGLGRSSATAHMTVLRRSRLRDLEISSLFAALSSLPYLSMIFSTSMTESQSLIEVLLLW